MANTRLIDRITALFRRRSSGTPIVSTAKDRPASETTAATHWADALKSDTERSAIIRSCRKMYKADPRARRILSTLARDATRGGFEINVKNNPRAQASADAMIKRLGVADKLQKWVRLTFRDGDGFFEVGVNEQMQVASLTRKPTLEVHRASNAYDQFDDPTRAFWWSDKAWARVEPPRDAVWFAEWQMIHARWDHDEDDRYGSPLFGSGTASFKRMQEGETDIAIRRKTRAGMKYHHVVDGDAGAIEAYKKINKDALNNPFAAIADYFTNKPGSITAIQGDAQLEEIGDVMHHVRTWWVASPLPMSLIGYGQDLNRDVLDKQKEEYDEELPPITAWVEREFVKPLLDLQWLLDGILPEGLEYEIGWKAKQAFKPEALSKIADAILRLKAAGVSPLIIPLLLGQFLPGIDLDSLIALPDADAPARTADAADSLA